MPKNKEPKPPREEKPKRRRRGFPVVLLLILLLIAIIAVLLFFNGGGGFLPGGNGGNSGDSNSSDISGSVSVPESSESNIAVIRVDGNDIYFDGEKCENTAALKEKITVIGINKEYSVDHSSAIKSTYDEVKQVLTELENALDIKVSYNE